MDGLMHVPQDCTDQVCNRCGRMSDNVIFPSKGEWFGLALCVPCGYVVGALPLKV